LLDGLYKSTNATYGVNAWYESRVNVLENYTNTSFPKTNQDNSALDILSVTITTTLTLIITVAPDVGYIIQNTNGTTGLFQSQGRRNSLQRECRERYYPGLVLGKLVWYNFPITLTRLSYQALTPYVALVDL